MIKYTLACDGGHRFDEWFSGWDDFEAKRDGGELTCPECGSAKVAKTISAPNIGVSSSSPEPAPAAPSCGAGGCGGGMCPGMMG